VIPYASTMNIGIELGSSLETNARMNRLRNASSPDGSSSASAGGAALVKAGAENADSGAGVTGCGREVPVASPRAPHVPSLDGLRGVAILLILLVHFYQKPWLGENTALGLASARIFGFGRYGVELFFVLSGFLITGILIDTRNEQRALRKFYMRRFLRIFPLYYGALVAVLWVAPHFIVLDPGAQKILSGQVWLWTYLSNFPTAPHIWDDSNLFLLGHFWSLCVEEHFYIFWPIAVICLSKRSLFWLCLFLLGFGFVSRSATAMFGAGESSIWMWLTFQRIDGLAIGALIAVSFRSKQLREFLPKRGLFRVCFAALACLCLLWMWWPRRWHPTQMDVFAETVVVLFCGFLLLFTLRLRPQDRWQRVLSSRALTTMGKYSYGLYIIHGILRPWFAKTFNFMALSKGSIPPLVCLFGYYVATIGISFILAYCSFHIYEKPWLSLKRYFGYEAKRRQCGD